MALRAIQLRGNSSTKTPRNRSLTPGNRSRSASNLKLELRRLANRKKKADYLLRLAYNIRNARIRQLNRIITQKQLEQKNRSKMLRDRSYQHFRKLFYQMSLEMDKEILQAQNVLNNKKKNREYIKREIKIIKKLSKKSPQAWAHFKSYIRKIEMAYAGIVPLEEALKQRPKEIRNGDHKPESSFPTDPKNDKSLKKDSKIKFKFQSEICKRTPSPSCNIIQGPYSVPKPHNFIRTHSSSNENRQAPKLYQKIKKQKGEESSQLLKLRDGLSKDTRMIRHLEKSLISIINKTQKKYNNKKSKNSTSHSLIKKRSKIRSQSRSQSQNRSKSHSLSSSRSQSKNRSKNVAVKKISSKNRMQFRSQSNDQTSSANQNQNHVLNGVHSPTKNKSKISIHISLSDPRTYTSRSQIPSHSENRSQSRSKIRSRSKSRRKIRNKSRSRSKSRIRNRSQSRSKELSTIRSKNRSKSRSQNRSKNLRKTKNAILNHNRTQNETENRTLNHNKISKQSHNKNRNRKQHRSESRIMKRSRSQKKMKTLFKGLPQKESKVHILSHIESKTSATSRSTHIPAAIKRKMALDEKKIQNGETTSSHLMIRALRKFKKFRISESSSMALGAKKPKAIPGILRKSGTSIGSGSIEVQIGVAQQLNTNPAGKQPHSVEEPKKDLNTNPAEKQPHSVEEPKNMVNFLSERKRFFDASGSVHEDGVDEDIAHEYHDEDGEDNHNVMATEHGAGDGHAGSRKWAPSHRNTPPTRFTHDLISGAHDHDLHELVGEHAGELKQVFSLLMQDRSPTKATDLLLLKRYSAHSKGYDDTLQKLHHRRLKRCHTAYEKILNEAEFEGLKKQMGSRMRRVLRSSVLPEQVSKASSSTDDLEDLSVNNHYDVEGMLKRWEKFFNEQTKTPFQLELERKHEKTLKEKLKLRRKQRSLSRGSSSSRSKSPRRFDLAKHFSHPRLTARQKKVEKLISQSLPVLSPVKNTYKCSICGLSLSHCSSISVHIEKCYCD
ncbi:uncharacterized protein LOC119556295 [Drosophila subpulchrella]|uniref:uncharacterized protein LOC119556295 n=1 Tax=Drosophila subpulchrella TaxID=1486046 RepID=UPI0018A16B89|nr:uncharacterized protein LOC119556295 [Drosophila subpulchrella]